MNAKAHAGHHAHDGAQLDSQVLCGCANLTYEAFREFLTHEPGLSFEEVLSRTGSGGTCTACLLDLEYHFSDIQGKAARRGASRAAAVSAPAEGAKQRIYRFVDGISPLMPFRKRTWSPVVIAPGIEQWLWIANQNLLYQDSAASNTPCPIRADIVLLDDAGTVRMRERHDVEVGEALRLNLTDPLVVAGANPEQGGLGIGTLDLTVTPLRPGMWGTTRPQLEIVTPKAACAVHTQGASPARSHHFTCRYRPREERIFAAVTNPTNRPLHMKCEYELLTSGGTAQGALSESVELTPKGAWIGEVAVPSDVADATESARTLALSWHFSGRHKLHLLCASTELDRFSIDHL